MIVSSGSKQQPVAERSGQGMNVLSNKVMK